MADEQDGLSLASDDIIDPYCEVCAQQKSGRVAAIGLCQECNVFICMECLSAHKTWPGMSNHKIFQGGDMPQTQNDKPFKFPGCDHHRSSVKDRFCLDHMEMVCCQCVLGRLHGRCHHSLISDLCKDINQEDAGKFRESIVHSIETLSKIKLKIGETCDDIERQKKLMKDEAEELRQRLVIQLQSLSVDDINIADVCDENRAALINQANSLQKLIQGLKDNIMRIDKIQKRPMDPKQFIELRKIAENVQEIKLDLEKYGEHSTTIKLSFLPNSDIISFISSVRQLGLIEKQTLEAGGLAQLPNMHFPPKIQTRCESNALKYNKRWHAIFVIAYIVVFWLIVSHQSLEKMFLGNTPSDDRKPLGISEITYTKTMPLNISRGNETCSASGMAITADGTILVVVNGRVKVFDRNGLFISSVWTGKYSWSIALISSTEAAISYLLANKLDFLDISNPASLSVKRHINGYKVVSMAVVNATLAIVDMNSRSVKLIDFVGEELRSFYSGNINSFMHVTSNFYLGKAVVIVTNLRKDNIMVYGAEDGKLLKDLRVKGKRPMNIVVDSHGNAYIVYHETSEIAVWTPDLVKNRILLTNLSADRKTIYFSNVTNELFIMDWDSCVIDRFKIVNSENDGNYPLWPVALNFIIFVCFLIVVITCGRS